MNNITKSQIKPPKKNKRIRLPNPPQEKNVVDNLSKNSSSATGLLQFHVSIEIKRQFKIMAAEHDISQLELFLKIFNNHKNI